MMKKLNQKELEVLSDRTISCGIYPWLKCNLELLKEIIDEQYIMKADYNLLEKKSKALNALKDLNINGTSEYDDILNIINSIHWYTTLRKEFI